MNISDIESWVDGVSPQPMRQVRRKPKHRIGKRSKYLSIVAVLLIVISVGGYAGIFSFFVSHETTVTSSESLLTWDDGTTLSDAEELQVGETLIDFVGGDSEEYIYWLNYSADADSSIAVDVQWFTGNVSADGFVAEFYNWTAAGWGTALENDVLNVERTLTMAPGDSIKVKMVYSLDEKAEEGSYTCTLLID